MSQPSADAWFRRHDCGVTAIVTELLGVFQLSARPTGAPTLAGGFVKDLAAAHVEGDRLVAVHFDHTCSDRCDAWTQSGAHQVNHPSPAAAESKTSVEPPSAFTDLDNNLLRRIKSEFLEMPGLRLTTPQAKRLWGLDDVACSALLAALVDSQFLFRTRDGAFMRIEYAQTKAHLTSVRERSAIA